MLLDTPVRTKFRLSCHFVVRHLTENFTYSHSVDLSNALLGTLVTIVTYKIWRSVFEKILVSFVIDNHFLHWEECNDLFRTHWKKGSES